MSFLCDNDILGNESFFDNIEMVDPNMAELLDTKDILSSSATDNILVGDLESDLNTWTESFFENKNDGDLGGGNISSVFDMKAFTSSSVSSNNLSSMSDSLSELSNSMPKAVSPNFKTSGKKTLLSQYDGDTSSGDNDKFSYDNKDPLYELQTLLGEFSGNKDVINDISNVKIKTEKIDKNNDIWCQETNDKDKTKKAEEGIAKAVAGFNSLMSQRSWIERDEDTGLLMTVKESYNCNFSEEREDCYKYEEMGELDTVKDSMPALRNLLSLYNVMTETINNEKCSKAITEEDMFNKLLDDSDDQVDVFDVSEGRINYPPDIHFSLDPKNALFQLNPLKISILKRLLKNLEAYAPYTNGNHLNTQEYNERSEWITDLLTKSFCNEPACFYRRVFPDSGVIQGPIMWPISIVDACLINDTEWNTIIAAEFLDALVRVHSTINSSLNDKTSSFVHLQCLVCFLYHRASEFVSEQSLSCSPAEGIMVSKMNAFKTPVGFRMNSEFDNHTVYTKGDWLVCSEPLTDFKVLKTENLIIPEGVVCKSQEDNVDPWTVIYMPKMI